MSTHSPHVAVIGGGPAGATCATLLARAGHRVTLYEKAQFPRYHIGESLAPAAHPILEMSGALPKVEAAGFITKLGGLMRWGGEDFTIQWESVFGAGLYTWEVDRARFDQVLLEHARDSGVKVHEGTEVRAVRFTDHRPTGVEWRTDTGTVGADECDYVVDASGRAGVVGEQTGNARQMHDVFRNVAIWGYWTGADLLPGTPGGGLDAVSCPTGWYWTIPLPEDRFSVGFVTHKDQFQARRREHASVEDLLLTYVAENDDMQQILGNATYVGPARVETDYSYVRGTFAGPGYLLIGDAACFLDPLLSTGTHLALYSALIGAATLTSVLDGDVDEVAAFGFFERRYRHAYDRFLSMVSLMYQQYRGKETYFWHAQRLVHHTRRRQVSRAAFTLLISGMADLAAAGYTTDGRTYSVPQIPLAAVSDPAGGGLRLVTEPKLGLVPA
jgi:flavin-dependent dehydrogenase